MADGRQEKLNANRRKIEPRATCATCDKGLVARRLPGSPRFCSPECKAVSDQKRYDVHNAVKNAERRRITRRHRAERRLARAAEGSGPRWVLISGLCRTCGKGYSAWTRSQYCSATCRGSRKTDEAQARRNARTKGWKLTKGRRLALYERDCWVCQICGIPVDREAAGTIQPDAPVLDHVVALADGGPHSSDNLQTAHQACNLAKESREGRMRKIRAGGPA